MQGKGIVRFFLVVMTIVTLIQYLFIVPTQRVEKDADTYAKRISDSYPEDQQRTEFKKARTSYLDSMSTETVLSVPYLVSFTYQDLKSNQLALGLDLKGGMSVILQVDLREFIRTLAGPSSGDPTFEEALEKASEALKSAQTDYVSLFVDEFRGIANGKKLAEIFSLSESLRDEINLQTSDGEVERILRTKANETVELTFNLLKQRIDKLGVTQPNVSLDAARDLIIVELPGIDNPERARTFLQAAAKLEFWNVYRITDTRPMNLAQAFIQANERLQLTEGGSELEPEIVRIDTIYATDSLGNEDRTKIVDLDTIRNQVNINSGPLFEIFTLSDGRSFGQAIMGIANRNQREKVMEYLNRDDIKSLFPRDIRFHWARNPVKDIETGEFTEDYRLFALRTEGNTNAKLSGENVIRASADPDPTTGEIVVTLVMDNQGTTLWSGMTERAAQDNQREIAILLDGEIVSAPSVNEKIPSGSSRISGSFSLQEAEDLSSILEVGKLPAETKIIQEALVGPSLGAENINRSLTALIIGFALVFIFMVFYYGGAGIVSILCLLLNLFFIFGALASYGTVLTLPGIAGIVLTIGMAVDANVIIYERIREELHAGKTTVQAIADGFKYSYSAIIDANVTTILTAFVLAYFGLGPIKGFAVVLIIGVISSLFTAVLVGRMLLEWWTKGRDISFSTSMTKNAFNNLTIDWLSRRKIAYGISGTIIVLGIVSMFVRGFDLGVDFKGGYSYNITFEESTSIDAQTLRNALTTSFDGEPVVKAVDTENTFNVVTDYLVDSDEEGADSLVMFALYTGVNEAVGGNLDLAQFKAPDGLGTHVASSSKVGPTIADDIANSAWYASIFSLLLIFLYIFLRFNKWQYSLGAVSALFHDVLVVLGLFSIFHGILPFSLEIDQNFIAAILTVIGYSINDTVVVFDRIREYLNTYIQKSKHEVINMAVNSTVSRTIITSLTTLFVVAILFVFGGSSITGFAFALLVGIIVGTYSSIFVATPIMSDLSGDLKGKKVETKKKQFSTAAQKAR